MLKHHLFALLGLCAILIFSNCNNDDDPSFTEADLTIENGWSVIDIETNLDDLAPNIAASLPANSPFSAAVVEGAYITTASEIETVEVCAGDDVYTFLDTGMLNYNNAGTNCAGGDDAVLEPNTNWALTSNLLTISIPGGENFNYTVKELSATRLVLESSEPFNTSIYNTFDATLGDNVVITITMRAN